VKPYLLDVNVLIALAWPNHIHHPPALNWFLAKGFRAFRTCPITQVGFIRISSHPAFTKELAVASDPAVLLSRITAVPGHEFWPDDVNAAEAFTKAPLLATHRQVTDYYLLALSVHRDGILATFDRGIRGLAKSLPGRVELIQETPHGKLDI
jgi:uncharacterized protein